MDCVKYCQVNFINIIHHFSGMAEDESPLGEADERRGGSKKVEKMKKTVLSKNSAVRGAKKGGSSWRGT